MNIITIKRKLCKKKGIASETFVYILAVIIIALVLIFGYRMITKTKHAGDEAQVAYFIKNVENRVFENSPAGRRSFDELKSPGDYKAIIFIATSNLKGNEILNKYPFAKDVAESTDNVFLIDKDGKITPFSVGPISIDPDLNPKYGKSYGRFAAEFDLADGKADIPFSGYGGVTCIGLSCDARTFYKGDEKTPGTSGYGSEKPLSCEDVECDPQEVDCTGATSYILNITADNCYQVYVNGASIGESPDTPSAEETAAALCKLYDPAGPAHWVTADVYTITFSPGKNVIAVKGIDDGSGPYGIQANFECGSTDAPDATTAPTSACSCQWKCMSVDRYEPEPDGWYNVDFDDSSWPAAEPTSGPGSVIEDAGWIWGAPLKLGWSTYCRLYVNA